MESMLKDLRNRVQASKHKQPKRSPIELSEGNKRPHLVRGIQRIGKYIFADVDTPCDKSLVRMFRNHRVPVFKLKGVGWCARSNDLDRWMQNVAERKS